MATRAEQIVQPCVTTIAHRGAGSVFGLAALLNGAYSAGRAYALRAVANADGAKVLRLSDTVARFAVAGPARELALQNHSALEELKAAKVAESRESTAHEAPGADHDEDGALKCARVGVLRTAARGRRCGDSMAVELYLGGTSCAHALPSENKLLLASYRFDS